jgi:hypothetical protein
MKARPRAASNSMIFQVRKAIQRGAPMANLNSPIFFSPKNSRGALAARRFSGTARTAHALHPGVIFDTNLKRSMNVPRVIFDPVVGLSNLIVLKSIPQGAATQCYVATNPALAAVSGQYFADCNIAKPRADAEDLSLAKWLWDVSEKIASAL